MVTRHFFKVLALFTVMIGLGLAGVFMVNSYGREDGTGATAACSSAEC